MTGEAGWRRGLVLGGLACAMLAAGCGGEGDSGTAVPTIGLETPNSPLVTLRVMVGTGSVDDPAGKHGLNALTALMVGRGGTVALTYEVLTTTLYPWAASIGTQASDSPNVHMFRRRGCTYSLTRGFTGGPSSMVFASRGSPRVAGTSISAIRMQFIL